MFRYKISTIYIPIYEYIWDTMEASLDDNRHYAIVSEELILSRGKSNIAYLPIIKDILYIMFPVMNKEQSKRAHKGIVRDY